MKSQVKIKILTIVFNIIYFLEVKEKKESDEDEEMNEEKEEEKIDEDERRKAEEKKQQEIEKCRDNLSENLRNLQRSLRTNELDFQIIKVILVFFILFCPHK